MLLVTGIQQSDSVIHLGIYIYIFFFRFFSFVGCYKLLSIVPLGKIFKCQTRLTNTAMQFNVYISLRVPVTGSEPPDLISLEQVLQAHGPDL